jgi:GR25 family glycosyltransferase involved in LPS biosynthesis
MITWHNKDLCQEGFIINLASRPDRKESALLACAKAGINGISIFDAVTIKDPNYVAYGCTQSHIDLYKYQVENNIPYMLILEDDISTIYNYANLVSITDINKQKSFSDNLIDSFNTLKPDILWLGTRLESNVDPYDNYLSFSNKTLTSHGYICSYRLAKFALENFKYTESGHFSFRWPIDYFLSQIKMKDCGQLKHNNDKTEFMNNNIVITVSNCLIFNQKADFSNIINQICDYSIWILGCHEEYCFKIIKDKINYNEYI